MEYFHLNGVEYDTATVTFFVLILAFSILYSYEYLEVVVDCYSVFVFVSFTEILFFYVFFKPKEDVFPEILYPILGVLLIFPINNGSIIFGHTMVDVS